LINNRQAGRRRGRNNPRQNGGGGNRGNGGDSGNRIDNRARGNAAQLLEKYRNMARDAQLTGDRVNMEYYLQFADHYFRVLADNRARQEENQQRFRRPDENDQDDDFGDEGDGFDILDTPRFEDARRDRNDRDDRDGNRREEGRREEGRRDEGPRDDNRRDRNDYRRDDGRREEGRRDDSRRDTRRPQRDRPVQPVEATEPSPAFAAPANDVVNEAPAEEAVVRPRATRARKPRPQTEAAPELGLDSSILPPAIGRPVEDTASDGEEAPAPRRTRRPRSTPQAAE